MVTFSGNLYDSVRVFFVNHFIRVTLNMRTSRKQQVVLKCEAAQGGDSAPSLARKLTEHLWSNISSDPNLCLSKIPGSIFYLFYRRLSFLYTA